MVLAPLGIIRNLEIKQLTFQYSHYKLLSILLQLMGVFYLQKIKKFIKMQIIKMVWN